MACLIDSRSLLRERERESESERESERKKKKTLLSAKEQRDVVTTEHSVAFYRQRVVSV